MSLVLVTEVEYRKAEAVFREHSHLRCEPAPGNEQQLAAAIREKGANHVVVSADAFTGPLYEALRPGSVIARFGVGHDGIDKAKATNAALLCTNTPGVLTESVAEYVITLLLSAARHIPRSAAELKSGKWAGIGGGEVQGKTLTIVGCGPIGRRTAQIASFGLQMKVVGCELPEVDTTGWCEEFGFSWIVTDFGEAVAEADFVSLNIPGGAATSHFLNAERLSLIPPRAWIINTARGSVVDEVALYDALTSSRIAGAALDVFEAEPYVPRAEDKDLRTLDNVIVLPHSGSNTAEANAAMARRALKNIELAEVAQYDEMDLLNPEVLPDPGTCAKT